MGAKDIRVRIQGNLYTLYHLSQICGIPWNTLRRRYYDYQVGDNLIRPVHHVHIRINGKGYTLRQLSTQYHLNPDTLYSRYRAGKQGKDLVRPARGSMRPRQRRELRQSATYPIYFHNELWTFAQLSHEYGINSATLRGRYYRGDRNDTLVRPVGQRLRTSRRPMYIEINGIRSTFRELSQHYGLPSTVLHDRYYEGKRGRDLVRPMHWHQHPKN